MIGFVGQRFAWDLEEKKPRLSKYPPVNSPVVFPFACEASAKLNTGPQTWFAFDLTQILQ